MNLITEKELMNRQTQISVRNTVSYYVSSIATVRFSVWFSIQSSVNSSVSDPVWASILFSISGSVRSFLRRKWEWN